MGLGDPSAWLWSLVALPIVVLYVLRVRMRREPVSTTLFWEQVFEEKRTSAFWHRLRHLLSLLVQLAFLLLLVFALLDPRVDADALEARHVVFVLDVSASMQAVHDGESRFEEARAELLRQIADLRPEDQAALVCAGARPSVVVGSTSHRRSLADAARALEATDGPTGVAEAAALARRILAGDPRGEVLVLTDGAFEGAADLAHAEDVVLRRYGEPADNVAITRFQARRSLLDPRSYDVLAEIRNLGAEPRSLTLELLLGDRPVDVVPLTLGPGECVTHEFEQSTTQGGLLRARLEVEDALAVDDEARTLLDYRAPLRVALLGEPSLFLKEALDSNALVTWQSSPDVDRVPDGAEVTIFHQRTPATLPPGPVLVIDPRADCDVYHVSDAILAPSIDQQDRSTPLMAHVDLSSAYLPVARSIETRRPHRTLVATLGGEPLYALVERPEGPVLVLTLDLLQGDLPLRTAFPILIANALGWFGGDQGAMHESLSTGESAALALDALGISSVSSSPLPDEGSAESGATPFLAAAEEPLLHAIDPGGARHSLRARRGLARVGPFDRAGLWYLARAEDDGDPQTGAPLPDRVVPVAVNLCDAVESDLRGTQDVPNEDWPARSGLGGRPLWFLLAGVALLFSLAEWWLHQRRRLE